MPDQDPTRSRARIPAELSERARRRPQPAAGPAPGRILAAAASVSTACGLIALLAGSRTPSEVVIEVRPTPVVVEQSTVTDPAATRRSDPATAVPARTVEPATPAPAPAGQAEPVARSEGS